MNVTGSTRVFFCIADPIDQVRAPEVFNAVFARHGIDAAMVPLRVSAARLDTTLRALLDSPSVGGISLSIPHKSMAVSTLDRCSQVATAANAVNAVRRNAAGEIEGDLFDGAGFTGLLDRANIAYVGRRVLIIGAGGAAAAVSTAMAARGAAQISLYDPDHPKAHALAAVLERSFGIKANAAANNDPRGFDLIVNATPLGLKADDPVPVEVAAIDAHAAVCDILMKNQPTPLIRAARARSLAAEPGFDMLIQQTPLYLEFFGYPELADAVRADDTYLRTLLFPAELTHA
ncbi:shikimate dehydrogenase [Paraburkholderia sp.]|uniref:shikimate dehydrogenase family protein n=1 Tax=Paraburkholderia sp. TaxID=1926495 RepID=UPI0023A051C1|nr:shikimate dehydrogenase [Paraburkholderia sp.]MDE1179258.1 shikimate dehydrogenase [Paraburkholderia sp.]